MKSSFLNYIIVFNNGDACILNQKDYFAVFSRLYSYFRGIKLDELKWTAVEKFSQVANEIIKNFTKIKFRNNLLTCAIAIFL